MSNIVIGQSYDHIEERDCANLIAHLINYGSAWVTITST